MTVDGDGEETPDLRRSVARQRWSIMFLAKAGDTESLNKAKKEKLQVCTHYDNKLRILKVQINREIG